MPAVHQAVRVSGANTPASLSRALLAMVPQRDHTLENMNLKRRMRAAAGRVQLEESATVDQLPLVFLEDQVEDALELLRRQL